MVVISVQNQTKRILLLYKIGILQKVVPWLRLHAANGGGPGLIPGQETISRSAVPQLKIPHAAIKTWHSQINKYL